MKITNRRPASPIYQVGNITPGKAFFYEGNCYVRTKTLQSTPLEDYEVFKINDATVCRLGAVEVTPVDAEVVIT